MGATIAALKGLSGGEADDRRIVLIAGGAGKGADFTPLAEPIAQTAKAVLLLGESAAEMADVFKTHDSQALKRLPIKQVENLNDAVQAAQRITEPGDSVLLSPACASFDMFQNYQERGERFVEAVSVHVKRVRREMSGEL